MLDGDADRIRFIELDAVNRNIVKRLLIAGLRALQGRTYQAVQLIEGVETILLEETQEKLSPNGFAKIKASIVLIAYATAIKMRFGLPKSYSPWTELTAI